VCLTSQPPVLSFLLPTFSGRTCLSTISTVPAQWHPGPAENKLTYDCIGLAFALPVSNRNESSRPMAAGGIHGCHSSHSKERSDLSDSLLPCHAIGGAGYDGIRPAKRVRDSRRTTAERCAESGCQPYPRSRAEQYQLRRRAL